MNHEEIPPRSLRLFAQSNTLPELFFLQESKQVYVNSVVDRSSPWGLYYYLYTTV